MATKIINMVKDQMKHYITVYKTDQILKLYGNQKYDKIVSKLKNHKQYQYFRLNDYNMIYFAISEQNTEFIDKFLTKINYKDQVLSDTDNPNKFSPTTFAALNSLFGVNELLLKHNANIYTPNSSQNTLLHIACFYNKIEAVKYALEEHKFNINAQNSNGETPLHMAILNKNYDIIKYLLENDADPLIKNNKNYYPIYEAIIQGDIEAVKLLESSIPKIKDNTFTVIHLAAQLENTEILHHFTNGQYEKLTVFNKYKETPLHYAVISNSEQAVRYLLQNKIDIDAQDINGNTALHLAVLQKNMVMLRLLGEEVADATILNKDKLSPLDLCYSDRDISMINFFRSQTHYIHLFRKDENDVYVE